jgi:hypothetical protein
VYDAPQDVKRAVLVVDGGERTGYRGDDMVKCLAAREGAMMRDGRLWAIRRAWTVSHAKRSTRTFEQGCYGKDAMNMTE